MTNFPCGCRLLWLAVTTVETHFGASESGQCQAQAENVPRVGFLCWVTCGDAYHEAWRRQCNCHRAGGYEHWRKRGMLLGCKFVEAQGCVTSARIGNDIAATQLAVDRQVEHRPKNNSSVLHEWSGTFIRGWREVADLWLDERRAFAAALDERKCSK
jgi:hypothetical protein